MERIIDRFDAYMASTGLNDNKVTVQLNLSKGLIGKSRKPGRELSNKIVTQILETYTDLSRVWLLTGEGPMLINTLEGDPEPKLAADQIPQLSNVEILLRDLLAEKEAKIDALNEMIWELKAENARLQEQLRSKGGVVAGAEDSLSASA